jgi:2'-5' RNA ligase
MTEKKKITGPYHTDIPVNKNHNIYPQSVFETALSKYMDELNESRQYSCAMAYLDKDSDVAKKVIEFAESIPEEELYVEEEGHGRELEPHATILYGLHSNNPDEIYEALQIGDDIQATLGNLSFFENDKYNVLKIDVQSDQLKELNKKLTDSMDYTNDYPDYHAHMTIAYLNKEADMSKYTDNKLFEGVEVTFPFVKISGPDANKFYKIKDKND